MPKVSEDKPLRRTSGSKAGKRATNSTLRNGRKSLAGEFFTAFTLEELAEAQGVSPMKDPRLMAGAWPEDEDVDQFVLETYRNRG
jgi:hypothetical protein